MIDGIDCFFPKRQPATSINIDSKLKTKIWIKNVFYDWVASNQQNNVPKVCLLL